MNLSIESTELFAGPAEAPRQILRVTTSAPGVIDIEVTGEAWGELRGVSGTGTHEVPVTTDARPGDIINITVNAQQATMKVAEPGWSVYLVSHFHYDPVWWNTQAGYASEWEAQPDAQEIRMSFQFTAFQLIDAHLELARRDPDYKFVLAEVDYLKPYWDTFPENRAYIAKLVDDGRLEIMGGTYNEPNTNLTGAETTIRNAVYGVGFQRDVLGGEPSTAWQLDAFGHDPQFPGMMADAGLTSSAWARGPFHQWGPILEVGTYDTPHGDPSDMQFRTEFEWISPSGRGLLTHYMAAHYGAGWSMDSAQTLEAAEQSVYGLFQDLKKVAATRNVLVPVGTDYSPPNKWLTDIHRDWNARYVWPRFLCAIPREFFSAVTAELAAEGRRLSPQTRDMNPIYTGKDVSYIDTKQAQRAAENELLDAERFAALASLAGGAEYPEAALDKAWRQLVFGAHHDAITGTESDQVYLDLLAGWREAYDLAGEVHTAALKHLAARTSTEGRTVIVYNANAWPRTDVVRVTVPAPFTGLTDETGAEVPCLVERADGGRAEVVFLASDVPSVGYRSYRLAASGAGEEWAVEETSTIENEFHRITVDPARGGGVVSLVDLVTGDELITAGEVGNELVVYDEYHEHPVFREGPWHLLPTGVSTGSAALPARSVTTERSRLGRRITVTGALGPITYTQTVTLWNGLARVDCATHVDGFDGADKLVRLRWPCAVPGAMPVSEVGHAVVGRPFAHPDVDTARHPWTLDNPAYQWFGLSAPARISFTNGTGVPIAVAEIVVPHEEDTADARDLAVKLAQSGVTSTTSYARGTRYGLLSFDSNLPDVRFSIGGPLENTFTAEALHAAGPAYTEELDRQLAEKGSAVVWLPARYTREQAFHPESDLRGVLDLPVVVIVGSPDNVIEDHEIRIGQAADHIEERRTVAVLNRGVPGFAVDTQGRLHMSLMRSSTGWPSGMWIDPPRRTAPDGTGFGLQHWSHTFDYALASGGGDWRDAGIVAKAHDYNHPLRPVVEDAHEGPLPATASFVTVEPAGQAVLAAFKAAGNPTAGGGSVPADPRDGVTARFYEPHGRGVPLRVTSPFPLVEAAVADLLETATSEAKVRDGVLVADLGPSEIATFVLKTDTRDPEGPGDRLGRTAEPAQPVFSRYWLHNRGSAPLGYQPLSVYARTAPGTVTVSLASDLVDATAEGEVRVVVPPGWEASPSARPVRLAPRGWTTFDVAISPPAGAGEGPWPVAVTLTHGGQTHEDVVFFDGFGNPAGAGPASQLAVDVPEEGLSLSPGERAVLPVTVTNHAGFAIRGEVQVLGPWGTWEVTGALIHPLEIGPGESRVIEVVADVPLGMRPGEWWLLVKAMWFGRVSYSPSVPFEVQG